MSVTLEQLSERITTTGDRTDRYLVVRLGDQRYGLRQRQVQGIASWSGMTSVTGMPRYVPGVLQQGKATIPVIDMRHLFKFDTVPFGADTAVILVKSVSDSGQARALGLLVDAVLERRDISPADVTQPRDLAETAHTKAAIGVAATDAGPLILLDTDRLGSSGALQSVDGI